MTLRCKDVTCLAVVLILLGQFQVGMLSSRTLAHKLQQRLAMALVQEFFWLAEHAVVYEALQCRRVGV